MEDLVLTPDPRWKWDFQAALQRVDAWMERKPGTAKKILRVCILGTVVLHLCLKTGHLVPAGYLALLLLGLPAGIVGAMACRARGERFAAYEEAGGEVGEQHRNCQQRLDELQTEEEDLAAQMARLAELQKKVQRSSTYRSQGPLLERARQRLQEHRELLHRLRARVQRRAEDLQIILEARAIEQNLTPRWDQHVTRQGDWEAEIVALDEEYETNLRLGEAHQELASCLGRNDSSNQDELLESVQT